MTVYTHTARFDGTARALSEDEMRKLAPSIFATTAHESRSDRFRPIPTIEVLRGLEKEGFSVVGVKQATARDHGKAAYTKHLVRLRRLGDTTNRVGDVLPEVLLKNANDGSAAYNILAGLFRIACLNSLVAMVSSLENVTVRHSGDVTGKVIDGTYTVIKAAHEALAAPANWSGIKLDHEERNAFATGAHILRFGDADGNVATPIQPAALLRPRRQDDNAADLWTTFNVVQENAIRGGMSAFGRDANMRRRRFTARAVNGIDQDVRLNRALFTLAAKMAEYKGAPAALAA